MSFKSIYTYTYMLQGDFMVCLSIFHDYQANVEEFLSTVLDSTKTSCSELGQLEAPAVACTEMWFHDLLGQRIWAKLEAITNLLKSDAYRKFTWSYPGRIRKDHEKTIFFELVEGQNSGKTCQRFEESRFVIPGISDHIFRSRFGDCALRMTETKH